MSLVGGMQRLHPSFPSCAGSTVCVERSLAASALRNMDCFHIRRCFSAFTQAYLLGPEKAGALEPKDLSWLSESPLILFPGLQNEGDNGHLTQPLQD